MGNQIKIFVFGLLLVACFQNCAPGFSVSRSGSGDFASASVCDGALKPTFEKTFYPMVSRSCSSCHISGGVGNGQFADSDKNLAYSQFMAKGPNIIESVAKGSHYFPASDIPDNITTMETNSEEWGAAYGEYLTCMSSGPGGPLGSGKDFLQTIEKMGPATMIPATPPAGGNATYSTLTFDLESELKDTTKNGKFKAIMTIQVRPFYRNAVVTGFQFTNPIIKLKTGVTEVYMAVGLNIGVDSKISDLTTFDNVSGAINNATGINLAPGSTALLEYAMAGAGTKFDLRLDSFFVATDVKGVVTNPSAVTFTTLTTGNGLQSVLIMNCVRCHNAAQDAALRNFLNYDQAAAKAELMVSRMNNPLMPMPRDIGLLPVPNPKIDDPRDVIQQWINNGKPR